MQRQWLGRVVQADVLDEGADSQADGAGDVRSALARHWGPAFQPAPTSDAIAADIVRKYTTELTGLRYPTLSAERMGTILRASRDAAPRCDVARLSTEILERDGVCLPSQG